MVRLNSFLTDRVMGLNSFTPTKQRLAIGLFGLVSQTTIDATNKDVDEDTREYSAVRTAAKIIITTLGGIASREIGQKAGEWLINSNKIDIPQKYIKKFGTSAVKQYGNAMGAACAIVAAAISVFAWDMPVTNKLMNWFMDKYEKMRK